MKKLNSIYYSIMLFAGLTFIVSSCSDDEPVVLSTPTITFASGISSTTAFPGDTVNIQGVAMAEAGVNAVRITIGSQPEQEIFTRPSGVSQTEYLINENIVIDNSSNPGDLFVEFTVVSDDVDQLPVTEIFTITVEEGIDEFVAVLIGGFNNNSLGSSYDTQADSVFTAGNLRNMGMNQSRIDFVYYFADIPQRTIASPDNNEAEITWNEQNTLSWPFETNENSTRFKATPNGFDFEAATSPQDLANAFSEVGTGESRVTDLSIGQTVAFQLDAGRGSRFGVFEVINVEGNSSGAITIDVKIQLSNN
ncbi:MAG: hypothetical protein AAF363_03870 [Bacteroidota bacterium]